MALEDLVGPDKFLDALVITNPEATDVVEEGDDHLRGIKNVTINSLAAMTDLMTWPALTPIIIPDVIEVPVVGGVMLLQAGGGNVGIGVAAADQSVVIGGVAATLKVNVALNGESEITSRNAADSAFASIIYNAIDHKFENSGVEAMRLNSQGRLGIGVASPLALQHIVGDGTVAAQRTALPTAATNRHVELADSGGGVVFAHYGLKSGTANWFFGTDQVEEAFVIANNGNVGVNLAGATPSEVFEVGAVTAGEASSQFPADSRMRFGTDTVINHVSASALQLGATVKDTEIRGFGITIRNQQGNIWSFTSGGSTVLPTSLTVGAVTAGTGSIFMPTNSNLQIGTNDAIVHTSGVSMNFGATAFATQVRGNGVEIRNNQGNIWTFSTGGAFIAPAAINMTTGVLTLSSGRITSTSTGGVLNFDIADNATSQLLLENEILRVYSEFGGAARTMAIETRNDFFAWQARVFTGNNAYEIFDVNNARVQLRISPAGEISLFLPTSLPATSGVLWNDGGFVKVVP